MIIEDLSGGIQKLVDGGIANGVVHIGAGLAGSDDVFVAKHCELLRRVGLLNPKFLTDFGNCPLAVTKTIENRNAKRMSKSLEKFCLELSQLRRHLRYDIRILLSAHLRILWASRQRKSNSGSDSVSICQCVRENIPLLAE